MRIALAQIDTAVGDIAGNAARAERWIADAQRQGCDLVVFPELTLPGYPAEDLYLQPHFAAATLQALERLAPSARGIAALVGFAEPIASADRGPAGLRDRASAHNAVALLRDGRISAVYRKRVLPSYGVFDEARQFVAGNEPVVAELGPGLPRLGLTVCEDCWAGGQAAREAIAGGAELILNAAASPWYRGRSRERESIFTDLARSLATPVALCNLVGAQDGLVFEGQSLVIGADGAVRARAGQFREELVICELEPGPPGPVADRLPDLDEVRAGLLLGLRDYVAKNGFRGVVLGLSGGIDSALVAALAVEALGPERVTCLVMPSPHSSRETQEDARRLAGNLGARLLEMPIDGTLRAYEESLAAAGGAAPAGPAAGPDAPSPVLENVQARIRGNLVMAISNRDGLLALSCGNKSEASVGYATLYGDMAGGLSPIKDLPKTLVYELAREINRTGIFNPGGASDGTESAGAGAVAGAGLPIPESILERAPSAELRPGQRDLDSLPPYESLDRALEAHLSRDLSRAEMVAEGIPAQVAERVIDLVRGSEHKRHQAAPGIRVTPKALDADRRMPITNRYSALGEPDGP